MREGEQIYEGTKQKTKKVKNDKEDKKCAFTYNCPFTHARSLYGSSLVVTYARGTVPTARASHYSQLVLGQVGGG